MMLPALALALSLASAPEPAFVETSTYALVRSPSRQDLKPGRECRDLSELECALTAAAADALAKGRTWQARSAKLELKLRAETAAHERDTASAKIEADALAAQLAEVSAALEDADGVDPLWVIVGVGAGLVVGALATGLVIANAL
jgi:hypothetical protein